MRGSLAPPPSSVIAEPDRPPIAPSTPRTRACGYGRSIKAFIAVQLGCLTHQREIERVDEVAVRRMSRVQLAADAGRWIDVQTSG